MLVVERNFNCIILKKPRLCTIINRKPENVSATISTKNSKMLTVNQWKHDHIKLITVQQKNFLMYISYVAVYAYLTSSGLTTTRRVLYKRLSKLITYVCQFVTVSPLWNTLQS